VPSGLIVGVLTTPRIGGAVQSFGIAAMRVATSCGTSTCTDLRRRLLS
jgi:hypothetical protein